MLIINWEQTEALGVIMAQIYSGYNLKAINIRN